MPISAALAQVHRGSSPYSERYLIAIHEAGHAVVIYCLGVCLVEEVSIHADAERKTLGHVLPATLFPDDIRQSTRDEIAGLFAGRAAVEMITGHRYADGGYSGDDTAAYEGAQFLAGSHPSDAAQVGVILAEEWARAGALVGRYRVAIEAVAAALLRADTLDYIQFAGILEGGERDGEYHPCLIAA